MRTLSLLLATLTLVACQKPPPAPAAPSAITRFSPPLAAHGTEPFWGVKLEGSRLTLSRPDHSDVAATTVLKHLAPTSASWEGRTADGRVLSLAVVQIDCSDGMSDRQYGLGAEVRLDGEVLKGCAEKPAR